MANLKDEEEEEEAAAKLECFVQWLQANRVDLRGCKIKPCDSNKGFGIFSANAVTDGILLVVPLDLAIAPMRVLQDPLIGPECRAMFEEGEVDDRFLIILFLMVERLRKNSSWKPYFDMLPKVFGNPLWFSDDEFSELKGTTLYRATELQRKSLTALYNNKVKRLVEKILTLDGGSEREVCFEEFLWANSVFWARALNLPLPRAYVFQEIAAKEDDISPVGKSHEVSSGELTGKIDAENGQVFGENRQVDKDTSTSTQDGTVWVEGLVPGIDFCNHGIDFCKSWHRLLNHKAAVATWEIDGTGLPTGVPFSMYLLSAGQNSLQADKEITISYGNKGNEELLYLYGFVIENNPDDYLMVHYPLEALQNLPFSDSKLQLLEAQKAEMRCLLPKNLLNDGFFPQDARSEKEEDNSKHDQVCSYSWSGHRKIPSYVKKLIFPDNFMSALRTIAMKEDELFKVSELLEELVGSGSERQPTDTEVRAAVWEVCGDLGALQLLVDLLYMRMTELEEHTGNEDSDTDLLNRSVIENEKEPREDSDKRMKRCSVSRNTWSSIVYRRGQKQVTRRFLREAEHALELALSETN